MGLIAPLAQAASDETSNLAQDFATCLGRYAAQQNYDRLMGRDVSEAAARAQMFGELLDAIAPAEDDGLRALRKSRKGAEGAHWTLLHSADFSFDPASPTTRKAPLRETSQCAKCWFWASPAGH